MVNRIKQVLEWQQLSPTQFADRIGIGRPVVSHILSERNKPSLDVLQHIRTAFPELSTDWLLDGIGPMLRATSPALAAPAPPIVPVVAAQPVPAESMLASLPTSPAPAPVTTTLPPAPTVRPAIPRFQRPLVAPDTAEKIAEVAIATPAAEPVAAGVATAGQSAAAVALPAATLPATASQPLAELLPASLLEPVPAPLGAAALLAEPGKVIRRIVIFYRDGSFADFQPEA